MLSILLIGLLFALGTDFAVGYEFSQRHRIYAGTPISKSALQLDPSVRLKDIFIGSTDIDFAYCDEYLIKTVFYDYVLQLNSRLEFCVLSPDCPDVDWANDAVAEVQCNVTGASKSYATAIDIICTYEIEKDFKNYVTSTSGFNGSLALNVNEMKAKCHTDTSPHIVNLLLLSAENAVVIGCLEDKKAKSALLVNELLDSWTVPYETFALSSSNDYGCDFVTGLECTKNVTNAMFLRQIIAVFDCIRPPTDIVTTSQFPGTVTIAKEPGHSQPMWRNIAITFIVLSIMLLLLAILMFLYWFIWRRRNPANKSPPTNNNQPAFTDTKKEKAFCIGPYASSTLVKPKTVTQNSTEPPCYKDRGEPHLKHFSAPPNATDNYYEPVLPVDKPVPAVRLNLDMPIPAPSGDRSSVGSYVIIY